MAWNVVLLIFTTWFL